jgi:hypothetical protein
LQNLPWVNQPHELSFNKNQPVTHGAATIFKF